MDKDNHMKLEKYKNYMQCNVKKAIAPLYNNALKSQHLLLLAHISLQFKDDGHIFTRSILPPLFSSV